MKHIKLKDIHNELLAIANNLKDTRLELGITMVEVAKHAGVTRQAVFKFEKGLINSRKIYDAYIELISEVLENE